MGMFDFMKKKGEPVPSAPDIGPDSKSIPPLDDIKMDSPPVPGGLQPSMSEIAAGLNLHSDAKPPAGENVPGIWQQPQPPAEPGAPVQPEQQDPVEIQQPPEVDTQPPQALELPKEAPQELELPTEQPFPDTMGEEHGLELPTEPAQDEQEVSPDPAEVSEDDGPDLFSHIEDEPKEEIKPIEEIDHPAFEQPAEESMQIEPEITQMPEVLTEDEVPEMPEVTTGDEAPKMPEVTTGDEAPKMPVEPPAQPDTESIFEEPSPSFEASGQPPEELDPFSESVPPAIPVPSSSPSRKIINQALYINVEEFQNIAQILNGLGDDAKMAEDTLFRIKDIALGREKVFDKWQGDIESVERELIQLDKLLFNV